MAWCLSIKRDGTRCRRDAQIGQQPCYVHDVSFEAAIRQTASKAGRTGGRGRPKHTPDRVIADVLEVIKLVKEEGFEAASANAIFRGYGVILRAIDLARDIRDSEELAAEVQRLKARLDADDQELAV
jgi:hypothetical protein